MDSPPVCVDASFILRLFMGPDEETAWRLWDSWLARGSSIHSPALLGYEIANALHRYRRAGFLSLSSADLVLDAALSLPTRLHSGRELHARALRLAADLSLPATYDAHYLAVAEQFGAELWTADARLAAQVPDGPPPVGLLGRDG
ncbi:MAG TPA: type II toxin-antitoxin system VapC family toxin [Thermoleophilia bacterium]|nr:type II toxin-antitoxin system VapC family toxin [Thermoleophilia bacterium]